MSRKYHPHFVGEEPEGSEASKPTKVTQLKGSGNQILALEPALSYFLFTKYKRHAISCIGHKSGKLLPSEMLD